MRTGEPQVLVAALLLLHCSWGHKHQVRLHGAGASFPSTVYKSWLATYRALRQLHVSLDTSYHSVGSGAGRYKIMNEPDTLEFAGSDALMSESDYAMYPDLKMFPVIAGAVVVGFNVPGVSNLTLTTSHLVGIYNGTIRYWNDSSLQQQNPHASLPAERIRVIARADKSGSTEIFTRALSSMSPAWEQSNGFFSEGLDKNRKPVYWLPDVIEYFGYTSHGMIGLLQSIDYTIAYVAGGDAFTHEMSRAQLVNREGYPAGPTVENVQAAMDSEVRLFTTTPKRNLVNAPGNLSYPLAGFSFFLIHLNSSKDCSSAMELYRFMEWVLFDQKARQDCTSLYFVPVSYNLATKVLNHLKENFVCEDGQNVSALVIKQKAREGVELQVWRTPVIASSVLLCFLTVTMLAFIIKQQLKHNAALLKGAWKVSGADLTPVSFRSTKNSAYFSGSQLNKSTRSIADSMKKFSGLTLFMYRGTYAWVQCTVCHKLDQLRMSTKRAFLHAQGLKHINIGNFIGVTQMNDSLHLVMEFDTNGILHDVLQNDRYTLDDNFKFCLALDVASGMAFLHQEGIVHSRLTSSSCCIDTKWNVKIADWTYHILSKAEEDLALLDRPHEITSVSGDDNALARSLFWVAPEVIINPKEWPTTAADVYSFSMLLIEIFTLNDPYADMTLQKEPQALLCDILEHCVRPPYPSGCSQSLQTLLQQCWCSIPNQRPSFSKIIKALTASKPSKKGVLDCMMEALKDYVEKLEDKVEERTSELAHATDSMRALLYQMLPPNVADKLQQGITVEAESYNSVTVYFSDIVGFTTLSSKSTPMEIVQFLNTLYTCFDAVLDRHEVYKVETIGDAYMVISGLPRRNGIDHVGHIATMALELMKAAATFKIQHLPGEKLNLRAGMHSGPVAAGVVGIKMPRYCLFGDTVNTASRMESTSEPMFIQLTQASKILLDQLGGYQTQHRGTVFVKGKGEMDTYWLLGKDTKTET